MSWPQVNSSWGDGDVFDLEFPLPTNPSSVEIGVNISINEDYIDFDLTGSSALPPFLSTLPPDLIPTEVSGWSGWDLSSVCLVTVLSALIVVTVVGNLLVCLSVVLVKKLRKPQNYLLVSLALSDLFVALFVMPFAIMFELHGGIWPLNYALCDLWVSADVLCCTASILNLAGISWDRYQAITRPLEYTAKTTPRRMLGIIFMVWLLSACVSLPPVLLLGNVHTDTHEGVTNPFCSVSQNFWYQIYATMASFYVPLVVMLVVYFKILRVVADKKKQMSWKNQHQSVHRTSSTITANSHSIHSGGCGLPLLQPQLGQGQGHDLIQGHDQGQGQPYKKDSVASAHSHYGRSSGSPLITVSTTSGHNNKNGHLRMGAAALVVSMNNGNSPNNVVTTLSTGSTLGAGLNNNKQGQANGVYFFPTTTLHRLKREKLFGGLKEHKASTVLGIIMSAFVICWLPFFILAIMRPFLSIYNIDIPNWASSLSQWLGFVNSALNPLIYATLNRDFRRPFKEILCFRCSTLDTLMRREFYQEQYGDDKENMARRMSRAHVAIAHANALDGCDQIHEPLQV